LIKDESPNPTASFKDRASSVVVARAREIGAEVVVTASTGNAGAALAGMAAAVGQRAVIFAPKSAPPAKIAQLLVFNAQVLLVDGNYDQAVSLALASSKEFGWYCRNTGYNPFTAEGKKTAAFELWEYLESNGFKGQDKLALFVSVGDGNIISGIHKGFKDLQMLGWMEHMPRIFGIQSVGSAAIAQAFFNNTEDIKPVAAKTLADSISVDMPSDGVRALRAANETNGAFITVEDNNILNAIAELGRIGIFSEPAGATAYAGLLKAIADGQIREDEVVIVVNTGSGLKDINAAMKAVQAAPVVEPSLEAVKSVLQL
jgi:threonine synthase